MNGERLRRLLAARTRADDAKVGLEWVEVDELGPPGAAEVTARIEETVDERITEDLGVDPRDFRAALDVLLRTTEQATRRLDNDPEAPLAPNEMAALETVVRADGTRPSLLVRGGQVQAGHPLAKRWTAEITKAGASLTKAIAAVGRVEPVGATGNNFFGTCWVVDRAAGLVLTNLHVLHAMRRRLPHAIARSESGSRFRVFEGAFVDFHAESGSTDTHRFKVVEAIPSEVEGPGFERLDAAVLRLEPLADGPPELPEQITVSANPDGPFGRFASCCLAGYPGRPAQVTGTVDGVDWEWVNRSLFGRLYGVKRFAPGIVHRPLGTLTGDPHDWVFGHDATTLGGNSGSPVLNWDDTSYGLHFAGITLGTNCAHGVSAIADRLAALGVPISSTS